MKIKNSTVYLFMGLLVLLSCSEKMETIKPPNIIYILADDMGYGDVSIYNSESQIKTPNIDRLASEGMRFTDAHSPSAVCTPTRYGILTGRYSWRSQLPTGVLRGYGQALLEKDRITAASLLKENGYTTGVIGKWHLGLDWVLKEGYKDSINSKTAYINEFGLITEMNGDWIDFTKKPTDGPLNHGFDYSYILPASLDMDPYCYLENDVLTALPNDYTPGNDLDTGSYATGAFWRPGRIAKDFDFYDVLPRFIDKAKEFVKSQSQSKKPFFLYLPLAAPHSPWVPKKDYEGASGAGQYGDFVQMVDAQVGSFLKSLDENKLSENTIVIFASDNGPFWKPDFIAQFNHKAAYKYRGMKADIYEGGHRIPFIVRWPGKVKAGSVSNFKTTLTNLIATCGDIVGIQLNDRTGEDSQSIYPILLEDDEKKAEARPIVHHSSMGYFALRKGDWKLIEKRGSGGFSIPIVVEPKAGEPVGQLYNMVEDPSETNNLYNKKPELVRELLSELDSIRNH
ncbi:N-acetylgalactosamine-6-O-sulfatase [Arenibacter antarcticus]|uniref:Arylsulfatase n=1 Tax=Arenibacter antarcticus TaxID=2040469 RepID=A0ABW5VKD9_9FLAO|nr:arylsulfatase [Arenibacter sp. H213]MCM4167122.1 sulfatase [Arenibacter sp. H213]